MNYPFELILCLTSSLLNTSYFILHIFYFLIFTFPVVAQTIPKPVVPIPQPLPEVQPLPPLEELLRSPPQPSTPQPSPEQIPGTIIVQQFQVIGSTVFTQEQLAEILAPFTNRPISFVELLQAVDTVTELYRQQGYITSGAFIPPQTLENGTVKVEVVEGEVESINITGLERLKPVYIRSRLEIATAVPLNQNRLLNALQLLQLDPLIANLSAELAAGSRPGLSILDIKLQEADAFSAQLTLDNQGNPSVGTDRRIAQLTHNNLLGFGDSINVRYYNTDGSNVLDDASYTFPINPYNGTISFRYYYNSSEVTQQPFDQLDIESNSSTYELTYRQPLYQTPTEDFVLGLTATREESETSLLGIPFPLSRGADDDGQTKVSALRFFQEYTKRSNREVFAARSQFSLGIDAFGSTINDEQPDSQFFLWRGQAQYLNLLTPDTLLLLRSDLQLSPQALVALEQFSLGGDLSVRGYAQDAILADNGLFASVEIRTTILRIPEWQTSLQLIPFFDFGTVWNSDNTPVIKRSLYSVGLGLQLLVGDKFNARIDWGIPLTNLDSQQNSLQENGIYFTVQYTLF